MFYRLVNKNTLLPFVLLLFMVILLWAKAVDGDKVIQLGLRESGFPELFHATNAIYLIQESRDWLMDNGYAHIMAMINAAEGLEKAQAWLYANYLGCPFWLGIFCF